MYQLCLELNAISLLNSFTSFVLFVILNDDNLRILEARMVFLWFNHGKKHFKSCMEVKNEI